MPSKMVRYFGVRAAFLVVIALALGWLLPGTSQAAEAAFACESEPTDEVIDYADFTSCSLDNLTDNDFFRWEGVAGEEAFIRTRSISGSVVPCFDVFDPDQDLVHSACANSFVQSHLFTLDKNGTHTIQVYERSRGRTGEYFLQLERKMPSSPSAKNIAGFGLTEIDQFDLLGDIDFFLFEGEANDRVIVSSRSLSGSVVPCISLYNPDGTLQGTSCANSFVQSIDAALTQSGTHMVWLDERSVGRTGSYELTVDCLFGMCPAQGGLRDALDIGTVMNFDGTAADEMAALVLDRVVQNNGTIRDTTRVRIRDMGDRSLLKVITFSVTDTPKGMAVVPDLPVDDIAVLLVQPSGKVRVKIKDADTKATVKTMGFFSADWDARAIIVLEDMNANDSWEVGVLAVNRNTHQARLKIKDSTTGETLANILQ